MIDGARARKRDGQGDDHEERDPPGASHAVAVFPKSPRGRRTSTAMTIR
jgi:hypothetical protein